MNFINEDLDFSSYWHHFCKSTFKNTYFSSVNRTLHEKEMHGLNVNFDESSKYINHILNLWNEDCYLFKTMQHFCKLSLYPFFKDRDKKSFKQKDFKIKDFYKNFDKENTFSLFGTHIRLIYLLKRFVTLMSYLTLIKIY